MSAPGITFLYTATIATTITFYYAFGFYLIGLLFSRDPDWPDTRRSSKEENNNFVGY